ncbi:hypothetical protein [Sphingobacterium multivorum]|uniref:hypothetical protein n=1 Tax=Sphingobacterium multivorum TaxID=28454 RepID=UPI00142E7E99|nr:hypothetical protein [Sphingobacterium multivorum]QQT43350.1 hypothetical protein I6J00_16520 [Sphingobacterium multivorum]
MMKYLGESHDNILNVIPSKLLFVYAALSLKDEKGEIEETTGAKLFERYGD